MKSFLRFIFLSTSLFILISCGNRNQEDGKNQNYSLTKVASFINDTLVIVTYFSEENNNASLAKALWNEKLELTQTKDSATKWYLFVFNDLDNIPDISKDYKQAWNNDYMHYKSCVMDNGFGFTRFCYGIRLDMGRVGDWANFSYVNTDGSLSAQQ